MAVMHNYSLSAANVLMRGIKEKQTTLLGKHLLLLFSSLFLKLIFYWQATAMNKRSGSLKDMYVAWGNRDLSLDMQILFSLCQNSNYFRKEYSFL